MSGGVHSLKLLHRVIIKIPNETDRMEVLRGETRRGHLKFSCVNSCGFSDALRAIDFPSPSPPLLCITLHPRNKRYSSARVRVRERVQLDSYYTSNPIFSLSNYTNKINLCPSVKKSRWRFYVRGRLKPNL